MNDLISRNDMHKAIDHYNTRLYDNPTLVSSLHRIVDEIQPIESKIVHCKECINRKSFDCPMFFEERIEWEEDDYIECDYVEHDNTEDNYFCSCAEKNIFIDDSEMGCNT